MNPTPPSSAPTAPETAPRATLPAEPPRLGERVADGSAAVQGRSDADVLRVLVTGWQSWPQLFAFVVGERLDAVRAQFPEPVLVVVQGECPYGGVDRWAKEWAVNVGVEGRVEVECFPADWKRLGKRAGVVRNSRMVAEGADLCLAFPGPGSKGTWDCARRAVDAGIPVRMVSWSERSAYRWAVRAGFVWDGRVGVSDREGGLW